MSCKQKSMDSDFLDEIVYILEEHIRYDLSSQLCTLLNEFGIEIDGLYEPPDAKLTNIQDKLLDQQMEKDEGVVDEVISPVGKTKDGFFYLK